VIAHNRIPWFDLSFAREPTSISIETRTVFKDQLELQDILRGPASHSLCPTSSMPCLWANLGNVHVDMLGNNPTTKNVRCKICIVVEITLESKWMISRKTVSTNRSWKKMCMRFWACPSQCQDLTLKEVNKLWESYDPERIVVGGPRFFALNETDLKVTQCNIKDCTGWSTHWIIHVKVYFLEGTLEGLFWFFLDFFFKTCTLEGLLCYTF
jgi:hypothetical protein